MRAFSLCRFTSTLQPFTRWGPGAFIMSFHVHPLPCSESTAHLCAMRAFSLYRFTSTRQPFTRWGPGASSTLFTASWQTNVTNPNMRFCCSGMRTSWTVPNLLPGSNRGDKAGMR